MQKTMGKKTLLACFIALRIVACLHAQTDDGGIRTSDLMLVPTRIVIAGRDRVAEVYVINPSASQKTYSIGFVNFRMSETGAMTRANSAEAGDRFADSLLRVTPRRIVLGPKMQQVVRLQFLRPADLQEGEYRSNLVVRVVPDTVSAPPPSQGGEESLSITLTPIYGVAIPVIVRVGTTSATASIAEFSLASGSSPQTRSINFAVERAGNQSLYGDLVVEYLRQGEAPVTLGKRPGFAVFATNGRRVVNLTISLPPTLIDTFHGGILRVRYLDAEDVKGKTGSILASSEIFIP